MIEARKLSVAIGGNTIVSDVEFSARAGSVTVIIGPNGSGKTTLLKALSGDLRYSGSILLNGREISAMRPAEQAARRAVLPQATMLSFPFTVHEIVVLGISGGIAGRPDASLVDQALARVDLAGFAGRYYQELSGGEQQRVQFARVLCQVWLPVLEGRPRWLLLDEPVSSLDIRHQLALLDIARHYAASGGGVIAILHDLNLAAIYGDVVIAMRDGRIQANGTPSQVISSSLLEQVFDCRLAVGEAPPSGIPFVLPQSMQVAR